MRANYLQRFLPILPLLLILTLPACSSLYLDDCPENGVLGVDSPRIRSSQMRILLANAAPAAERLADYAAMSAYAYSEPLDSDCGHEPKLAPKAESRLQTWLHDSGWQRVHGQEFAPPCEDEVGLFYHVWRRETDVATEVVFSFRGTWGFNDWWYGNSYWFRRLFTDAHQYTAARTYANKVIAHFESQQPAGKALVFSSTGHSLGGGLAQAVLYDHVNHPGFTQAYAFDPSSATAYTTRQDESPFQACNCRGAYPEPRIYRIYESSEILANLRIFHKLIFPPEPWINEVRFNYKTGTNPIAQHSMARFAMALMDEESTSAEASTTQPWYASKDSECTAALEKSLIDACGIGQCNSPGPD